MKVDKKGLDILRNKIAQEGIGVNSLEEIQKQVPCIETFFESWKTLLGLPAENIFITANKEIILDF